jgi:hypothetical protein
VNRVSLTMFERQFERFKAFVENKSPQPFESFEKGYPDEKEGYKRELYEVAQRMLDQGSWSEVDIGTGKILKNVVAAIEIDSPAINNRRKLRNNLVQWWRHALRNRWVKASDDANRCKDMEALLFRLYRGDHDGEVFEELTKSDRLGRNYPVLAYLYFIKDRSCYMPINPKRFDTAFERLGIPLQMSGKCFWENYQSFNDVIARVRDMLELKGLRGVQLLDAHSFCWIVGGDDFLAAEGVQTAVQAPREIQVGAPEPFPVRNPSKTGPVDFEALNRERAELGRLGEEIAIDSEQARLREAGRPELAECVKAVSHDPSLGYDIESFETDGTPRRIEVKAVRASGGAFEFFISRNELETSRRTDNYYLYLVVGAKSDSPKVYWADAAALQEGHLEPVNFKARLPYKVLDASSSSE